MTCFFLFFFFLFFFISELAAKIMQCLGKNTKWPPLQLQQTTVWSDNSVNMMQGSCINEITRNNTLREEPSKNETQPNLAETIKANTCPGLCSGRGECDNGIRLIFLVSC